MANWQEIRERFLDGAAQYPDVFAHWESHQGLWTLRVGQARQLVGPKPEDLFKGTARTAVNAMGETRSGPTWVIWLDLMREGQRGFRRVLKPRTWSQTRAILEAKGPIDLSGVPLGNDGTIARVFKESADFCDDLAARSHRSNGARAAEGDGNGADRRAAVDAYIENVFKQTGKRITRTDIWKLARYKSRTEFERWERNDLNRPNKAANQRFTQILAEKPHLK